MKIIRILIAILLLLSAGKLPAQFFHKKERLTFPYLSIESQSNIIITADFYHPKDCPLKYTNLLSNTHLFSAGEQKLIRDVMVNYKYVSTNSGPPGSVFLNWGLRERKMPWTNEIYRVACFGFTNSTATPTSSSGTEGMSRAHKFDLMATGFLNRPRTCGLKSSLS